MTIKNHIWINLLLVSATKTIAPDKTLKAIGYQTGLKQIFNDNYKKNLKYVYFFIM